MKISVYSAATLESKVTSTSTAFCTHLQQKYKAIGKAAVTWRTSIHIWPHTIMWHIILTMPANFPQRCRFEYPFEGFRWSRWKYRAKCYILGRRRRSQSNAKSSLAELQRCPSFSLWMSFESRSCPLVFGGKTCQRGDSFGGYACRQSWQATAMEASQSGAGNLWDVHRSRNEGTKGRQASDVRWSDFMAMAAMDQHGSTLKALRTWEYGSADEFLRTHWHNFHPSPDSAHGWSGVALLMLSQKHAKFANWPESIG